MKFNGQDSFVFTPGQREEALAWIKQNCLPLYEYARDMGSGEDRMIDMYFKLKSSTFELRPDEFIVGIEYKNQQAVIDGKEQINIRLQNPRREKTPHDPFALQVIVELLHRLKG